MKKTSIIIALSPDDLDYTISLVQSIRQYTRRSAYQLIIVEHGNSSRSRDWLIEQTDIITLFHQQLLTQAQAWNAGLSAAIGDSVLFLHSDTLVTENWLDNMVQLLYQNDHIAGVGPLTNYADGEQAISVEFASIDELILYAKNNQRVVREIPQLILSDFCMLLKKEVIEQVGLFNQQLNGKALGIDYSLRVAQEGYQLMICGHSFVHHYGENDRGVTDGWRFEEIWGFDISKTREQHHILSRIAADFEDAIRVLVIGSGCGQTLLNIKNRYPNATLTGIENNKAARLISNNIGFSDIRESLNQLEFEKESFDVIVVNQIEKIDETLILSYQLVTPGGTLLIELLNFYNYSTILRLLREECLDIDGNGLHVKDLSRLIKRAGFDEFKIEYYKKEIQKRDNTVIKNFLKSFQYELPSNFNVDSYLITASKYEKPSALHEQFNILFQSHSEVLLNKLLNYSTKEVLNAVDTYDGPVIPLLNYLAISNYEQNKVSEVFPLLNRAYDLSPDDPMTLMNLGTVYYGLGEDENALNLLGKLPNKSQQVLNWIYELEEIVKLRKNPIKWLKFLLFRIEHNVQRDNSLLELMKLMESPDFEISNLKKIISEDIIEKRNTINFMINYFYELEHYDLVIQLLNMSVIFGADQGEVSNMVRALKFKYNKLTEVN